MITTAGRVVHFFPTSPPAVVGPRRLSRSRSLSVVVEESFFRGLARKVPFSVSGFSSFPLSVFHHFPFWNSRYFKRSSSRSVVLPCSKPTPKASSSSSPPRLSLLILQPGYAFLHASLSSSSPSHRTLLVISSSSLLFSILSLQNLRKMVPSSIFALKLDRGSEAPSGPSYFSSFSFILSSFFALRCQSPVFADIFRPSIDFPFLKASFFSSLSQSCRRDASSKRPVK